MWGETTRVENRGETTRRETTRRGNVLLPVSRGTGPYLYRRIVGRLISKVALFKPSFFVSSYGTVLMFSFVVWFNMCGDRSLVLIF